MHGDITTLSRDELLALHFQRERAVAELMAEQERRRLERDQFIAEKEQRIAELSDSVAALTGNITELTGNITVLNGDIAGLNEQLAEKQHLIEKLQRMLFGTKRERFVVPDGQLVMPFLADASVVTPEVKKELETVTFQRERAEKKHPGRMPLPEHLPIVRVVHEPTEDVTGLRCIGEETTDELVFEPGRFFIRRHARPKYITPEDADLRQRVIIAPPPERPIPKSIASTELLVQLILDKHLWHLPIHRQIERFKEFDVVIPSSTADDWLRRAALLLRPLHIVMGAMVPKVAYLQADETPIPVLDRAKKGSTHRGYLWAYHAVLDRFLYFDYRRGRGKIDCERMLSGFTGYLQTDGYAAYDLHKRREDVVALACWAHARRKFHEALSNDPARATEALAMIRLLYDVERDARQQHLAPEERKELRLERSLPVLNMLGAWLARALPEVLPKSPIGVAISYTVTLFDELEAYLVDGSLEIDTNLVENAIRPIALGRKNYLFAGSHDGAINIAMHRSFFGTCRLNEVDPRAWLTYVLNRIGSTPHEELHTLLPHLIDRSLLG